MYIPRYPTLVKTGAEQGPIHWSLGHSGALDTGHSTGTCTCAVDSLQTKSTYSANNNDNRKGQNCVITCLNDDYCRRGTEIVSVPEGLSHETGNLMDGTSSPSSAAFEGCVSPAGDTGGHCEHSFEECGNSEHMCLLGSKCVPSNDVKQLWTCECGEASGNTCNRHRSTECTSPDAHNGVYRGHESLILCVNDGVCTTYQQNGRM
jgi:hypothetical protein